VPHEQPEVVAEALERLLGDPRLRRDLGANLRRKLEREYSTAVVLPRWEALFEEVIAEATAEQAMPRDCAPSPTPSVKMSTLSTYQPGGSYDYRRTSALFGARAC
jgi:hypothetical protein